MTTHSSSSFRSGHHPHTLQPVACSSTDLLFVAGKKLSWLGSALHLECACLLACCCRCFWQVKTPTPRGTNPRHHCSCCISGLPLPCCFAAATFLPLLLCFASIPSIRPVGAVRTLPFHVVPRHFVTATSSSFCLCRNPRVRCHLWILLRLDSYTESLRCPLNCSTRNNGNRMYKKTL